MIFGNYRKPSGPSKALKLGGKTRDVEFFVDQLKSEGEKVASLNKTTNSAISKSTSQASSAPLPNTEKYDLMYMFQKMRLLQ